MYFINIFINNKIINTYLYYIYRVSSISVTMLNSNISRTRRPISVIIFLLLTSVNGKMFPIWRPEVSHNGGPGYMGYANVPILPRPEGADPEIIIPPTYQISIILINAIAKFYPHGGRYKKISVTQKFNLFLC